MARYEVKNFTVGYEQVGAIADKVPEGERDAFYRAVAYLLKDTLSMFSMQSDLEDAVDMLGDERLKSALESSTELAHMHLAQIYGFAAKVFGVGTEELVEAVHRCSNIAMGLAGSEGRAEGQKHGFDIEDMMSAVDKARRRK